MQAKPLIFNKFLATVLLLCSVTLPGLPAKADLTLEPHRNLAPVTQVFADESARLRLDEIRSLPLDAWRNVTSTTISLGFDDAPHWLRIPVVNNTSAPQSLYLEVGYARLDQVDAWIAQRGSTTHHTSGIDRPFRDRAVQHRHHLFPLELLPGEYVTVWLRVQTDGSLVVPLHLWDRDRFIQADEDNALLYGAYFGAWLMILVFNAVFYSAVPSQAMAAFVAFVFSFGVYQLATLGFGMASLWSRVHGLLDAAIAYGLGIAALALMWFTSSLLVLADTNRTWRLVLGAAMVPVVLTLVAYPFTGYHAVIPWISGLSLIVVALVFTLGIITGLQGNRLGWYATVAWSFLLGGVVLRILTRFEVFPYNFMTENATPVGFILMIFILSFVVAAELRRRRESNPLDLLGNQAGNHQLEAMVLDRTQELEDALSELSQANQTLREINTIDAVTGIKNRAYFDSIFEQEWKRASREKYPLSLLLLDIDHFKQVNDRYGHLAGDECLRGVAASIQSALKRPADIVARYGGEEFVVVLPYTENENALDFANRIRQRVESATYEADGNQVQVTVSIGVSTVTPTDDDDRKDVIAAADIALYEAKHSGRNQVRNAGQLTVHAGSGRGSAA